MTALRNLFEWIPFDEEAANGYGMLATVVSPTRPNRARSKDILMAGHAFSMGAKLMTRNPKDFELVAGVMEIVSA
ncbi:hypothetical protein BH09ACT1_BH09ACT1_26390 [soil metagenome]